MSVQRSKNRKPSPISSAQKIETRIARIRRLVLSERSNWKYFQSIKGRRTVTGRLLERFKKDDALLWTNRLRISEGVENELIFSLGINSQVTKDALDEERRIAIAHTRGVLFDELISESLIQSGWGKLNCMRYAHMAAELFNEPHRIVSDPWLAEAFADGVSRHGTAFLTALKDIHHNLERRKKSLVNQCMWLLAANWTNPHCPLWLMKREAIFRACVALSEGLDITQEMVNERLKKSGLIRHETSPIVSVKLDGKNNIQGFAISGKILKDFRTVNFKNSSCFEYTAFPPPKQYRVNCM